LPLGARIAEVGRMFKRLSLLVFSLALTACADRPVSPSTTTSPATDPATCSATPTPPQTWKSLTQFHVGYGLTATQSGVLIAAVDGLVRSTDRGETWSHIGPDEETFSSLSASGRRVVAIGEHYDPNHGEQWQAYLSLDDGASWQKLTGLPSVDDTVRVVAAGEHTIYAGFIMSSAFQQLLYVSHDNGASWSTVVDPLPGMIYGWLYTATSDDHLFAAGFTPSPGADPISGPDDGHVMRSSDSGASFAASPLFGNHCAPSMLWSRADGMLFGAGDPCSAGGNGHLQRSSDGGATFTASISPTFPIANDNHGDGFRFPAIAGNDRGDLVAVGSQSTVLYSNDSGASYTRLPEVVGPGILGIGVDLVGVWVGPCGEVVILSEDGTIALGR
jgi:hypothetical protein